LPSTLVMKPYAGVEGLSGPNVGGKHEARELVPAPMA